MPGPEKMLGELEKKARQVRKHWFDQQAEEKQDQIIKPHFDEDNPTNEHIKRRMKEYNGQT